MKTINDINKSLRTLHTGKNIWENVAFVSIEDLKASAIEDIRELERGLDKCMELKGRAENEHNENLAHDYYEDMIAFEMVIDWVKQKFGIEDDLKDDIRNSNPFIGHIDTANEIARQLIELEEVELLLSGEYELGVRRGAPHGWIIDKSGKIIKEVRIE